MSDVTEFQLTDAQAEVVGIFVDLIGLSGVHKQPERGDTIVLDLLPAEHVALLLERPQPFCVTVDPEGRVAAISDEEAGVVRGA